jgi:hypothetical protein
MAESMAEAETAPLKEEVARLEAAVVRRHTALQYCMFAPELQWQPRGILQGYDVAHTLRC